MHLSFSALRLPLSAFAGVVLLLGGGVKGHAEEENADAAATLVIYNQNDKDSGDLARFYAEKRGIAKEQVLGFKCAKTEEITRDEYDQTIAEPLRKAMVANIWWKPAAAGHQ